MTDLLGILEAEADAVARFIKLLTLEQVALGTGDTDSLIGFVQEKSAVSSELSSLAGQRNSALAAMGLQSDRAGVEAWLERQPSDLARRNAWSRVVTLASEAKELNRVNGELIQIRMQHNTQAIEAMQGATRTLNLYGPDGQPAPVLSRRINDAA